MSKKIIWITGGSSGIGFATAKYFLKNSWVVIISSSNIEKLTNAKNRTPGVSKIPVFENLFKGSAKKDELVELLIFIAPRVIE